MSRLRIRTRLLLGSAVLAAVALAVALLVARAEIGRLIHDSAVSLASSDLTPYVVDLEQNPGEQPDAVAQGLFIVIRDPSGATVRDTAPHDVRLALPARATDGDVTFGDDEGRSYVIVGRLVHTSQGDWSLWAARDVSSSQSAVAGIDLVFVLIGVGLLVLLIVASFFVIRGALRPVEQLRRDAERLPDGELLPVADNDDELARLAATLNDSVSRVRDAAGRERRMISDAAHELRTPLAGLAAELELIRRHTDDPASIEEGLRSAEESAVRLGNLATNLLELSRLEEGGGPGETETGHAIADELLTAVDRARTLAAGAGVEILDDIAIDRPEVRYRVGALAIGRVADNLLTNAIRALDGQGQRQRDAPERGAAPGTGRIVLVARDDDEGLLLRVQDDGPGAPDDFVPRAFERFSRAESSRRRSGSGLGLALVAAIAEGAGGTARAENTHPGFAVEVRLPRV